MRSSVSDDFRVGNYETGWKDGCVVPDSSPASFSCFFLLFNTVLTFSLLQFCSYQFSLQIKKGFFFHVSPVPRSSNEWILIILGLGKPKHENRELKVIPGYTVTACLMETGGGVGVSQWLWGTQCLSLALSIVDAFTMAVEICSHNTEHQKSLLFSVPPHVGLCPSVSHKYPWSVGPFAEWPPILCSLHSTLVLASLPPS